MMSKCLSYCFALFVLVYTALATAKDRPYDIIYHVTLEPKSNSAKVAIRIPDAALLKELNFNLDEKIHSEIKGNGKLVLRGGRALWSPPKKSAELSLRVAINHKRNAKGYDAYMNDDWAIFRGDDLIPAAKIRARRGATSRAELHFSLPEGWRSINTGWERDKTEAPKKGMTNLPRFFIDNPERRFDRPTGWMIAGKIATRRDQVGATRISISAPKHADFHRMDVLVFLNLVWPEMVKAFGTVPEKLLIVGAGDPMWRGGLSASNSFFLHADRPLVSENGTSTLLHEMVHMVTRVRGGPDDDWIAEGLAEFYAIELLDRAGGLTKERRESLERSLARWSKGIKTLRGRRSKGPVTARAVLVFTAVDREIRKKTQGKKSLDDVMKKLIPLREVSHRQLREVCEDIVSSACESLAPKFIQSTVRL